MDPENPIIIERGKLTEKLVKMYKGLGGDESLSLYSEKRHHVREGGRTLIDFGRAEGIVRVHVPYHNLPVPVKSIVSGLESIGYIVEYSKSVERGI